MKWTNPFILQILLKYNALKTSGKRIILFWIPSHVNIPGNDRADAAAKKALENPVTNLTIPYSHFRSKGLKILRELLAVLVEYGDFKKVAFHQP